MKSSSFSILSICEIIIAALSFVSCEYDDDNSSKGTSNFQLSDLKGTWTTVAVEKVPPSQTEDILFGYDFNVYWDDGYNYESGSDVGIITIDKSVIKMYDVNDLMEVVSYDGTELKLKLQKYDGAVVIVKKLGTLNDNDYKNKLCHGFWIYALDSSDGNIMSYDFNGDNTQQMGNLYGKRFQIVHFMKNGTGECYCGSSGYNFYWNIEDKRLSMKLSNEKEKSTSLWFVGIEGTVYLSYDRTFHWYQ